MDDYYRLKSRQRKLTSELSRILAKMAEQKAIEDNSDFDREMTIKVIDMAIELLERHLGWLLLAKAEERLENNEVLEEVIEGIEQADIRPLVKDAIIQYLRDRYGRERGGDDDGEE